MDLIRRQTLTDLLTPPGAPCVSLYVPLHPGSPDARKDPIRLRNLLSEAEERLIDGGQRRDAVHAMLQPLRRLTDGNTPWRYEGRGLAMFLAPSFERTLNLLQPIDEALFVGEQFHLRPLLPLVTEMERFFLLTLSQNQVRLYEGWAGGLIERDFRGPKNFNETTHVSHIVRGDKVHEGPITSFDRRAAAVKGPDRSTEDLRHFVREVAAGVNAQLKDETAPLVLATVESMVRLWEDESKYRHTLAEFAAGNADYLSPEELHARAWPVVAPMLERQRDEARRKLEEGRNRPRMTFGIADVVAAALHGRIDTLFIDCSQPRWGAIDPTSGSVELHEQSQPGDADLVEVAARQTLLHDGHVFPLVPAPHASAHSAEALLRY